MKKLALAIIMAFTFSFISCNEDVNELNEASTDLRLATPEVKTNIGTYKGVFTTLDSEYRGIVEVEIRDTENNNSVTKSFHTATIEMQTGDIAFATSRDIVSAGQLTNNISFSSDEVTFVFSVNGDGSNPVISNVIYNDTTSDIIIAKHTTRAPVTGLNGSYNCIGCNVSQKTFNFVIANDGTGNQTYTTQVNFNGQTYSNGAGYQNNCAADINEPTLTFCNAFSGISSGTNVGFEINGDPNKTVTWDGEINYNNEAAGGGNDCTSIIGNWNFTNLNNPAQNKSGVFTSDNTNSCLTELVFEGFGGATQSYTTSIPEFVTGNGYFIKTNGDDIVSRNVQLNGIIADYFFAAQDIDANGDPLPVYLTFENINVSSYNTIYFSAEFAEDDDGLNEDWDNPDYVHVDYSFDGGITWTTFFAIENDGSTYNSAPFIDTNLDGIGDGQEITDTFEYFKASFDASTASTVSIRITFNLDAKDEDIAIDNVVIRGKN